MKSQAAYELNGRPIARDQFYSIACDPRRSVAVEACAGAGKTWMLVSRIVRALLDGAKPHEILAITFTKKAAGEMRQRLQEWLAQWADAPPQTLCAALAMRGWGPQPTPQDIAALRDLYGRLLESGRPVQIRTFHSWFAALLRSAPLAVLQQLGLPTRYELLEDDSEAIARVWRRFFTAVAARADARLDYEASVAAFGRFQTQKALEAALAKRVEFALADAHGVIEGSVQPFAGVFPQFAGLAAPRDSLADEQARSRWMSLASALGREKNKTPQLAAQAIVDAFACEDLASRLATLRKAFLVAGEDRLNVRLAKYPAAQQAESELQALCAAQAQHEAWLHHQRMARLARLLMEEFAALKREHGWVDMNDVERAALVMLGDPVLSGWVQERLDLQVRHLLIDEFQDTNPLQWQALHAWLSSYAGAGQAPSVFIVGDPKQSIYRFRRAEPQVFRAAQAFIVDGLAGDLLSCDHTHRNAAALLEVVNRVMAAAQADGAYEGFRAHTTESEAQGSVLALPPIPREPRASSAQSQMTWRDSLAVPRELPEDKLITLECRQAAGWIAKRLREGVGAGDIMVLARRRDRLAAMEDELRALHIPTQQPEKTDLAEAPEVQDMVALLDVLVSHGHDLSLARALKSPLFGCSDDMLAQLALRAREQQQAGTPRSWWDLLHRQEGLPAQLCDAACRLLRWKEWVEALPPHDALQSIYDDADVLARFARSAPAPLRARVLANLRALLDASLRAGGGRYLSPYAFVRSFKAGGIPGPNVSAPDVVRLLTVHGAKGLEAPIVLVLDSDGTPLRPDTMGVICEWPGEAPAPWRFAFLASEARPPSCSADALAVELAARQREELNALYVAMTRAQRQLVVSSTEPMSPQAGSWWQRLLPWSVALEADSQAGGAQTGAIAVAQFDLPTLPSPPASIVAQSAAARAAGADLGTAESRFGEAVHRLLEWHEGGSGFSQAQLRRAAQEFRLHEGRIHEAAAMARRILHGEGAWAWDAAAVEWGGNEVELLYQGERLRLDRLVRKRASGEWWVLDYKSATRPEQKPELIEQLRRYRSAVEAAYPGAAVRAAFLTGEGALVEPRS